MAVLLLRLLLPRRQPARRRRARFGRRSRSPISKAISRRCSSQRQRRSQASRLHSSRDRRPAALLARVPQQEQSYSFAKAKRKAPPVLGGAGSHRPISTLTPGRDLLISTPGSRTRRRSSMTTSLSRTPLPTVMSRSRCTQFLLHSGPIQSSLHKRSALAGGEKAAEAAPAIATT